MSRANVERLMGRSWRRRPLRRRGQPTDGGPGADGDAPAFDPLAVEATLEVALRIYAEERDRAQSLTAKSSTLAGFSGAILALVAQFGREIFGLNLGSVGNAVAPYVFLVSVAALAAAACLALVGALRPRSRMIVSQHELVRLGTPTSLRRSALVIRGGFVTNVGRACAHDRQVNDLVARYAAYASGALLVGIVAAAALAAILAFHEMGL